MMEKANLDELLKTYKVRLKATLELLDENDNSNHRTTLIAQIACYRTFIIELEEAMQ